MLRPIVIASLFLIAAPLHASAASYGSGTYGTGAYGVGETAAVESTPQPLGSGQPVGSSPTAPAAAGVSTAAESVASSSAAEIVRLQSLIAQLTRELQALIAQRAGNTAIDAIRFERDLEFGMSGDDVRALQRYLNAHGFAVAISGAGSPGEETDFFGSATRTALKKFQKSNGISPAAGYFGPLTQEFISR